MNPQEKSVQEVLVFTQAGTTFGIYASCIEKISEIPQITRLPKAEDKLRGIMNYKGEILPVFSLFGMLGLPVKDTEKICLIIKDESLDKLAITIENAEGLYKDEAVCMAPPVGFRLGTVKLDCIRRAENNICVIDLKKTFQKQ